MVSLTCPVCNRNINRLYSILRILGLLVFLGGLAIMLFFWLGYDTTMPVQIPSATAMSAINLGIPDRVHNLVKMQEQQNGIIVGGFLALFGLICFLASELMGAIVAIGNRP